MGVLANHYWFVSRSAITTYLCWLCHFPLSDKEGYFVCLSVVALLLVTVCVLSLSLSLSLSIPYGMHLVAPTHPYFFWVACHPNRTFPPKEPKQEPRIGFPLSPLLDHAFLPLTHDFTMSCIGQVQAGDVWALCVLQFYVCSKLACCSSVCHDLETCLHILSVIFYFLWRGLLSDLPSFMPCSLWGLGFAKLWAFLPSAYSLLLSQPCHTTLPFLL